MRVLTQLCAQQSVLKEGVVHTQNGCGERLLSIMYSSLEISARVLGQVFGNTASKFVSNSGATDVSKLALDIRKLTVLVILLVNSFKSTSDLVQRSVHVRPLNAFHPLEQQCVAFMWTLNSNVAM